MCRGGVKANCFQPTLFFQWMVSITQIFIVTVDSLHFFENGKYKIIISECYEFGFTANCFNYILSWKRQYYLIFNRDFLNLCWILNNLYFLFYFITDLSIDSECITNCKQYLINFRDLTHVTIQHLPGGTDEEYNRVCINIQSPVLDSNGAPHKYRFCNAILLASFSSTGS